MTRIRDEQAAGILGTDPKPIERVHERPGTEDVPLVHGRVLASTRGYTGRWEGPSDPKRWQERELVPVDVYEHFCDDKNDRSLLRMRLRRSLGVKGKGRS